MVTLVIEQLMNCVALFPGFLISPKSLSRECSAILEDDYMSMDQTL